MKNQIFKRMLSMAVVSVLSLGLLAGCGAAADDTKSAANDTAKEEEAPAPEEEAEPAAEEEDTAEVNASDSDEANAGGSGAVVVGTGAYPNPYTYQDDDGSIKGMDIDLLRAIFEGSGYDFSVEATEFASVMGGLDTERYQIGANSFSKTPEREEKYLFSKPIYRNPLGLIVPLDSDIASFDDVAGKTTSGEPAVSYTVIVESYNEAHPDNPITINYTEKDLVLQFQDVVDGASDFKLESAIIAKRILADQGFDAQLKVIELGPDVVKERSSYSYYIFPKTDSGEEIRAFVNERLEVLRADGTIDKLYENYFGGDYKPSDEEFNSK
ncbi:transporter substrate-binding domain-containing protein [Lachnospiraceae bacterium ZAX-1]